MQGNFPLTRVTYYEKRLGGIIITFDTPEDREMFRSRYLEWYTKGMPIVLKPPRFQYFMPGFGLRGRATPGCTNEILRKLGEVMALRKEDVVFAEVVRSRGGRCP